MKTFQFKERLDKFYANFVIFLSVKSLSYKVESWYRSAV